MKKLIEESGHTFVDIESYQDLEKELEKYKAAFTILKEATDKCANITTIPSASVARDFAREASKRAAEIMGEENGK